MATKAPPKKPVRGGKPLKQPGRIRSREGTESRPIDNDRDYRIVRHPRSRGFAQGMRRPSLIVIRSRLIQERAIAGGFAVADVPAPEQAVSGVIQECLRTREAQLGGVDGSRRPRKARVEGVR